MNQSTVTLLIALMVFGCQPEQYGGETGDSGIQLGSLGHDPTVPEYEGQSWHERYVNDHCARCPECCVFVENEEYVIDRSDEELFCTPDVCPGLGCPCALGPKGLWWIDYTGFGTDEDPHNPIVPVENCGESYEQDVLLEQIGR